ncbi:MAG: L-threonylcarbamoyladenylate synthase [Gammaproteobacteria bacterium]|nr:L-threonylcarbamoyladenylate synthase [Gammaproteobacteria bacterium]
MREARIEDAVRILEAGGIVAYPTEAVYGLGCDPGNSAALTKLLALKNRAPDKGLILIAASVEQLQPWLGEVDADSLARCQATWPGPSTWVLPARPGVTRLLKGDRDTLAVRVTAHPPAAALCEACGHALVSTSANISGSEPARSVAELEAQFGDGVDVVVTGALGDSASPTLIRDARTGEVLRE